MENPPCLEHEPPWEEWPVSLEDLASFRVICSHINGLVCGYFNRNLVESQRLGIVWASTWIKLVHENYSHFLRHADPEEVDARCPAKVKMFYDTLGTLQEWCLQLPNVVYTMHFEPAEADAWHVRITTMSGVAVSDAIMRCHGPLNAWEHLPQPLYRIAGDGNLHTFQEYAAYYGEEKSKELWTRAAPCYDHLIDLVTADGRVIVDVLSCMS